MSSNLYFLVEPGALDPIFLENVNTIFSQLYIYKTVVIYWINKCMSNKLVILSPFLIHPKKRREGKKENELAKPVFSISLNDPFNNHL